MRCQHERPADGQPPQLADAALERDERVGVEHGRARVPDQRGDELSPPRRASHPGPDHHRVRLTDQLEE
jgi:hypothetical protein